MQIWRAAGRICFLFAQANSASTIADTNSFVKCSNNSLRNERTHTQDSSSFSLCFVSFTCEIINYLPSFCRISVLRGGTVGTGAGSNIHTGFLVHDFGPSPSVSDGLVRPRSQQKQNFQLQIIAAGCHVSPLLALPPSVDSICLYPHIYQWSRAEPCRCGCCCNSLQKRIGEIRETHWPDVGLFPAENFIVYRGLHRKKKGVERGKWQFKGLFYDSSVNNGKEILDLVDILYPWTFCGN